MKRAGPKIRVGGIDVTALDVPKSPRVATVINHSCAFGREGRTEEKKKREEKKEGDRELDAESRHLGGGSFLQFLSNLFLKTKDEAFEEGGRGMRRKV